MQVDLFFYRDPDEAKEKEEEEEAGGPPAPDFGAPEYGAVPAMLTQIPDAQWERAAAAAPEWDTAAAPAAAVVPGAPVAADWSGAGE